MCVCHLVNMWMPVLIMSGLGTSAVDAREESGLGEVQLTGVQPKCFSNHPLNAATHSPDLKQDAFVRFFLKDDLKKKKKM